MKTELFVRFFCFFNFFPYLCQMKTITYYKSQSGGTKCNHLIYTDEVSIKAQSSLILLNDYFSVRDVDFLNETIRLQEYLNRRTIFLIKTKRREGDLVCHYCGKTHLEIGYRHYTLSNLNNRNKKLATIDHVVPISSGIDELDETNWVVSCKKCNGRKGSKKYEEFVKIVKKV